jgi:hypothetical protein
MESFKVLNSAAFTQWFAYSLAWIFLAGGFAVLAVGLGLFFNSGGTFKFFESMNRWVSMRRLTKPLEITRDTRSAVMRHRRGLAVLFIVGGLFALYGLVTQFSPYAIIYSLRLTFLKPAFLGWLLDSARWLLIVGNLAAIAVGIVLAFFPATLEKMEARGSQWFSERQVTKGWDALRQPLDQKVAAHPRFSGLLMVFFGLVLIGTFGFMLAGAR